MELHAAVAPDVSRQARILVGNSVYEEADLTVRAGTLYLEFAAADIDGAFLSSREAREAAEALVKVADSVDETICASRCRRGDDQTCCV